MAMPTKLVRETMGGTYRYIRTELDQARKDIERAQTTLAQCESRAADMQQKMAEIESFFKENGLEVSEYMDSSLRV